LIVIDANLLYAYNASAEQHEKARRWLETALSAHDPVRLAWSTVHAFLRLTTHAALFPAGDGCASLAALSIENGAVLYTTDRDFRSFEGLQLKNPLA